MLVQIAGSPVANEVQYDIDGTHTFTVQGILKVSGETLPYKNARTGPELFPCAPLNYKNARTPGFARACMSKTEMGAARMLAALHQFNCSNGKPLGSLLYDNIASSFFVFTSHWQRVRTDFVCELIGTNVLAEYERERNRVQREYESEPSEARQKQIGRLLQDMDKAIGALRRKHTQTAVMQIAQAQLTIRRHCGSGPSPLEEKSFWDPPSTWIGAANGVLVNLVNGNSRKAVPTDRICTVTNVEWQGMNAPAPLWDKLIFTAFGGDIETADAFLEYMGYALTGQNIHNILPVLYGEGSNGKTIIKEILLVALAGFVKPISNAILTQPRGAKVPVGGHNSELADLKSVRIGFVAETAQTDEFREDLVKAVTGGDTLYTRKAHSPEGESMKCITVPVLITNYLPSSTKSHAMERRLRFFEFSEKFVEDPDPKFENQHLKDPTLLKNILAHELPGVLARLVRGAVSYNQRGKLLETDAMKRWANDYWEEQPSENGNATPSQFLNMLKTEFQPGESFQMTPDQLYSSYVQWCAPGRAERKNEFLSAAKKVIPHSRRSRGVVYHCQAPDQPSSE